MKYSKVGKVITITLSEDPSPEFECVECIFCGLKRVDSKVNFSAMECDESTTSGRLRKAVSVAIGDSRCICRNCKASITAKIRLMEREISNSVPEAHTVKLEFVPYSLGRTMYYCPPGIKPYELEEMVEKDHPDFNKTIVMLKRWKVTGHAAYIKYDEDMRDNWNKVFHEMLEEAMLDAEWMNNGIAGIILKLAERKQKRELNG